MDGLVDLAFWLWDAETTLPGDQIGSAAVDDGVELTNGLFTIDLGFGAAAFNGQARWLEVAVRRPAGIGS